MFPEDEEIWVKNLVQYAVGMDKFEELQSMEDTRNMIHIVIDTLKSCFLLLNGSVEDTTKMHDVVRDMALLIVSQDETKLVVKVGIGLADTLAAKKLRKQLHKNIMMKNKISALPNHEFQFPLLEMFLIQENSSLKTVLEVPKASHQTKDAKFAGNILLSDISRIAEVKDLQILRVDGTGIKVIATEVGQLTILKHLDALQCYNLYPMLHLMLFPTFFELFTDIYPKDRRNNHGLDEISTLTSLRWLELAVPSLDRVPKVVKFDILHRFEILIGIDHKKTESSFDSESRCHMVLSNLQLPPMITCRRLMKAADYISLYKIQKLTNILSNLCCEDLNGLKSIEISDCQDVSCLIEAID
ncbi:LOW QUALITY PROTEIN: hypothetical protein OSB04_001165 [Centaurea solstitialis]|uniref:Uncharacterized protein n=1 Tax=Centaurea solstitialis TaxID=347529 RepID=A0AA38TQT0_9ASTR|nr:LOW QUALITY PROTEIN: hypothetical protein OSB04_001165 [Centaurea solstitialis]